MRILFIARHDGHGNDDEGAVAHALRVLGHDVTCLHERDDQRAPRQRAELCLFFKWYSPSILRQLAGEMTTAFWWFDLVDYPDPTLAVRCAERVRWMETVMPLVHHGFCTDGDWVARMNGQVEAVACTGLRPPGSIDQGMVPPEGKLHWLPQGADERVVGRGKPNGGTIPLLFVGSRKGGQVRQSWHHEMEQRWPGQYVNVHRGYYGRRLADLIANAQIVLAPDGPVTNRYCSNRLFTTLGFGGFLLHPWTMQVCNQYRRVPDEWGQVEGLVQYTSREHLEEMIEHYLSSPERRMEVSEEGLQRTLREHLYRHRMEEMLRVIQGKP